jgi:predicted kinase
MKRLYLIRGLPGSGKSTLAAELSPNVFEADQFFYTKGTGYEYDKSLIGDAHAYCKKNVQHAMNYGMSPIAVANTFVKRWEMKNYRELAALHGYRVTEITMSGTIYKNIHDVPGEVIDRMRENWEA